ncbi:MAG: (1-_4)-alpha-D-glucan 1-alpha-D-glucosylmutase [Actinomycetota bacterium]|nr:(1->4)-alpha-D-glucan 1-alpha-D-glucosylmutase [Actinomycetota bacterium]
MTDVRATYRVQLHPGFTFDDVAGIAPYLQALGVSHVYFSPFLEARRGSTHGYDVVDHSKLNDELGGNAAYERMSTALADNGLGQILDIVPNHAAIGRDNKRWWDVLKHGRDSRYADFFDIDWDAPQEDLRGKVMAPVLGEELERVIERGELAVGEEVGEPVLRYYEHLFPFAPGTAPERGAEIDWRALLARQHYLLCHWRRAARSINYRRFFDINDLVALRMEVPEVFEATHRLVLSLVEDGHLEGLRVDHVDGLHDPQGYLEKLRKRVGADAYLVVEKILEPGEELPRAWPVEGTTGYDFLNVATGVLIDPAAEAAMTSIYQAFIGETTDLEDSTREKKLLVMRSIMASDIARLTRELIRVFENEGWMEATQQVADEARVALAETIAALPVYRTYISPKGRAGERDRAILKDALATARRNAPHVDQEIFDRLSVVFLEAEGNEGRAAFVARFQQASGPIMAKGVEDTLFYNYNRFVALNEVGGDPGRFGVALPRFHEIAAEANQTRPRSMLATSTHDTKRSDDVRARLALLSEIPDRWRAAVERWSEMAVRHRTHGLPDRNAEYLLWQTIVGAWPLDAERAVAFLTKATREAKRHTSWLDPNPTYETALESLARGVMGDEALRDELEAFVTPLIEPGRINSLAQVLIKLTYPGVPDTYQGAELWDLSLVDPDNRRPVDFAMRRALLEQALAADASAAWERRDEGLPKLFLTAKTLHLRRRRPQAFEASSPYEPLLADGPAADHALAYLRASELAVIAPRLPIGLREIGWQGTTLELPEGRWRDELGDRDLQGGRIELAELLDRFPVALLVRS